MTTRSQPGPTTEDWLLGAAATLWYASPDLTSTTRARRLLRGATMLGVVAVAAREGLGEVNAEAAPAEAGAAQPSAGETDPDESTTACAESTPRAVGARIAAIVSVGIGVDLIMRLMRRRLTARGWARPHLPGAVLAGAYSVASSPLMRRITD